MKRYYCLAGLCMILASVATATEHVQEIKPFVRGSYQQIVSSRQGKPFIVNFWSISCSYCIEEMTMLKKLAKNHSRLDLVLISTDSPSEKTSVSAVLEKFSPQKAEAWLFADNYTAPLFFEIDKQWHGELPRTYFFNAQNEVTAFSGKLEHNKIEQWIKQHYDYE